MKKNFTRLLTLCGALSCGTLFAQLTPEVLYYDFNGTGNTVPNLASAPPPGTNTANILGGVTQGGSGTLCDGALIGSGNASTTDYLNTNWAPNLGSGSWTISFRTSGISTNATLYYIFGDANTASFRCFTNGIAGSTNWVLRGAGLTDAYINGGALMTATMCTYVYDQGANQIRGYLNGVLVSTTAQAAPNLSGTGPLKVMGYQTNVGAPAGGLMDEFRVYSRAITGAEVAQLYNPFATAGFLGNDITFCNGDSTLLSLGWPSTTVAWSTGSTADSTWVSAAGQVSVSVTGACGTGMDTVMAFEGSTVASITPTSCTGTYSAPSGAVYTTSGLYMDTIPNSVGCDSIITINLVVGNNTTASISPLSCSTYTAPSGAVYTASGTYMDTITNASGCDSVITINLIVGGETQNSFAATVCDMYTAPSGAIYVASGTYMDTIPNIYGCDSVMTIAVTINMSSTSSMSVTACDMYTAPSGVMYTSSGTYMDTIANVSGCDSVITIQLIVNTSSFSSVGAQACDSYTAPSGAVFTTSGLWNDTIANMAGCDSIIQINLVIFNSSTSQMNANSCGPYTAPSGAIYTTSGTFMDTITNVAGCDSIIMIALNLTNINAGASVNGAVCTATGTTAGATFQWIDCSNMLPIPGAVNISYTATANGSYAVITTIGNCSDTSACVAVTDVAIAENTFGTTINLYPNPSTGNFFIDLGVSYEDVSVVITDLAGRVVFTQNENNANIIPVQLDAPAGVYVISIVSGDNQATVRLIKE